MYNINNNINLIKKNLTESNKYMHVYFHICLKQRGRNIFGI